MGTPDFALTILKELDLEYGVKLIVAQPDKPTGRKKEIVFNPVKQFAVNKNINILQPEKIKGNSEFVRELLNISPDIIYVAAYGKILSEEILKIPKYGCINIHASLLPKYRGAAPINWALINGDNETGITLMKMDAGMDTGDIISSHKINIEDDDNVESLSNKLANLGAKKLIDFTDTLIKKDAIERSISYMETNNLDLMSSVPYHICQDFWEKILCSFHIFLIAFQLTYLQFV